MKAFLKEILRDNIKHAFSLLIWSTLGALADASYSHLKDAHKKCEYTNWYHYHPARMLICKVLDND